MDPAAVLIAPVVTEKSTFLAEANKYVFRVDRSANKIQIREAVEAMFEVKVVKVNVIQQRGRSRRFGRHSGRTSDWKKAIVTLAEADRIDVFGA